MGDDGMTGMRTAERSFPEPARDVHLLEALQQRLALAKSFDRLSRCDSVLELHGDTRTAMSTDLDVCMDILQRCV